MTESDNNSFDALRKAVEQGNDAQREYMKKSDFGPAGCDA